MRYFFLFIFLSFASFANDLEKQNEFLITIKDHKFSPNVIYYKPNTDFKLVIENLDKTIEEFESIDLKKEKIVKGGGKITINISGLKEGEYSFFGDFHQKTAKGKIIITNYKK